MSLSSDDPEMHDYPACQQHPDVFELAEAAVRPGLGERRPPDIAAAADDDACLSPTRLAGRCRVGGAQSVSKPTVTLERTDMHQQPFPPPPPGHWPPPAAPPAASPPRRTGAAIAAVAAGCLIAGGITGTLITSSRTPADTAPTTAAAPSPTVPATPDPVCAEWAPVANSLAARQKDWGTKTNPKVPGSEWSEQQKSLTAKVIPVMQESVEEMRRLADKAVDPFLASLMQAQAAYEEAFMQTLGPSYQPDDHALWQATINLSGAVLSECTTVARR